MTNLPEIAVLTSGGIDSLVLCAEMSRRGERVRPVFVAFGLSWEAEERAALDRFLTEARIPNVDRPTVLRMPVGDLYGPHWSNGSGPIPAAGGDDREVYLPGRNLLLIAKTAVWCGLNGVPKIAIGTLAGNPFADAERRFLDGLAAAIAPTLPLGLGILAPFGGLKKREVMRLGRDLPLHLSLSCLAPRDGVHCGRCNKCAERREAFADAGLIDRTIYLS